MIRKYRYFFTFLIFAALNFGGLAIGQIWTGDGVVSDWYTTLNQAPWTPPGWVFGLAWTTIAITFSALMTKFWVEVDIEVLVFYPFALLLNILWNPIFFGLHWTWLGVVVLGLLSFIIYEMVDFARCIHGWKVAWLGLPYFIWLMIASSLNLYISIMN